MHILAAAADSTLLGITPGSGISDKTRALAAVLASLTGEAEHIVFCHGGDEQVHRIYSILENGREAGIAPGAPLDAAVAMSEGLLGFRFLEAIEEALIAAGAKEALPVAGILTQVQSGDACGELPEVLEKRAVQTLMQKHRFVLAGGSGGIPVKHDENGWSGIEELRDVNCTAASIADVSGADFLLMILPDSVPLENKTVRAPEARALAQNESTHEKVRSALEAAAAFVSKSPGRRAAVTHPNDVHKAVRGTGGLIISDD